MFNAQRIERAPNSVIGGFVEVVQVVGTVNIWWMVSFSTLWLMLLEQLWIDVVCQGARWQILVFGVASLPKMYHSGRVATKCFKNETSTNLMSFGVQAVDPVEWWELNTAATLDSAASPQLSTNRCAKKCTTEGTGGFWPLPLVAIHSHPLAGVWIEPSCWSFWCLPCKHPYALLVWVALLATGLLSSWGNFYHLQSKRVQY